jgi:hypothetical protein
LSIAIQGLICPQINLESREGTKSPDQRQDVTGVEKFGSKDGGLSGVNKAYEGSVVGEESG